ncbi:MAG: hypothetical protein HKL95_09070 [Phycisphaerae bacterium]|nr:hypothetical protein [Phycisphaerae bacterium]
MGAAAVIAETPYYAARDFSAGSLHKLLVHAMAAQWVWLSRWRGGSIYRLQDVPDYPTRESLLTRWPMVHEELATFLRAQTPQTLEGPLAYRNNRRDSVTLPLGELILHCLDHGTYHRGQINSMIKLAGGTPVSLNYYQFSLENPAW